MKDLYIIGAGGFGREVAWLIERINNTEPTWNIKGFIDDNESIWGTKEDEYEVVGGCEYLKQLDNVYAVCAVGSARVRKIIVEKFKDSNVKFATVIDPSVLISKRVEIGEGTIICAGTIITVDIKIGNHVIINLDCTIGHDDVIEDFVTIYPSVNVSGNVVLGECSEIGTGMQIIQGKKIGKNSIVGAGAVVVKDIPEQCTAVGSPAKPIKFHNESEKKVMIGHKKGFYERYIKRPQDFMCALLAIIVFSPVILIVAVLVKIKLGGPVLFTQDRPGKNGRVFKLYKFRTMTSEKDENGEFLPDEVRLTPFGKKLRSTSLDELPELLNILKGDMAVVGPRPLLVRYLPLYNEHQARRHEVRPGFTGYAQVHGRNSISWEEKFDKDVYYTDHITFLGDWKIILDTVGVVLRKEGVSSESSATMEEFKGTKVE